MSEELPPSLSTLVWQLAATALHYLGRPIAEGNSKLEVNLPLARHTIDTLEMLKQKTEGNRSPEETELLNDLLYRLRIAYLQALNESHDQSGKKREEKN